MSGLRVKHFLVGRERGFDHVVGAEVAGDANAGGLAKTKCEVAIDQEPFYGGGDFGHLGP